MLLLWTLLALTQAVFLPGFLVTRSLRLDDGAAKTWLLSFTISLVCNHYLVLLLVGCGLYQRSVLLVLILLEAALLIRSLGRPTGNSQIQCYSEPFVAYLRPGTRPSFSGSRLLLLVLALACFAYFVSYLPSSFTSVFEKGDAIRSWNRWAQDWAAGYLPAFIMTYPQLIPTTWSTIYVIAGNNIEFVPRGIMALFPASILLAYVDLGLRRDAPEHLFGALIVTVLLVGGLGRFVASGHVDIPVAFFALVAAYVLLDAEAGLGRASVGQHIAAATVAAIGCAMTKQAGLYVAFAFPVVVYSFLHFRSSPDTVARPVIFAAAVAAVLVAAVAPWYGYVHTRITHGLELSMVDTLTRDLHSGRSSFERAVHAWQMWRRALSPYLFYPVLALIGASLTVRRAWWPLLSVALPYTLLWSLLFSYDLRNHALALPFLAMAGGYGACRIAAALRRAWSGHRAWRWVSVTVAAGAVVALLVGSNASDRMLAVGLAKSRARGNPILNARLYEFEAAHGFNGKILTNYWMLQALPDMKQYVFVNRGAKAAEFWALRGDVATFDETVSNPDNEIRYILTVTRFSPQVDELIRTRVSDGTYRVLFRQGPAVLLDIAPGA